MTNRRKPTQRPTSIELEAGPAPGRAAEGDRRREPASWSLTALIIFVIKPGDRHVDDADDPRRDRPEQLDGADRLDRQHRCRRVRPAAPADRLDRAADHRHDGARLEHRRSHDRGVAASGLRGRARLRARSVPAPGARRARRRAVGPRRRARPAPGKTIVAEYAIRARARRRREGLLHDAAQGALEPEVRGPGARARRGPTSACSPATTRSTATRRSS